MWIAEVNIEKMFKAYVCCTDIRYDLKEEVIYHTDCQQEFKVLWKRTGYMGYGSWDGNYIHCPSCGKTFDNYNDGVCYIRKGNEAPLSMNIRLDEFKDHLVLKVYGTELVAKEQVDGIRYWTERRYKETFRFDIKKRQTIFTREYGTSNPELKETRQSFELGNPLDGRLFEEQSALRYLYAHKEIREKRSDIKALLKKLRERICQKIAESKGFKVKSMYVSSGSRFGSMLLPIYNIAYRMVCLDLPNLSAAWTGDSDQREEITRIMPMIKAKTFDLQIMRQSPDSISGLLKIAKIPEKKIFRRLVQEQPFSLMIIASLRKTFKSPNNIMAALQKIKGWKEENKVIDISALCKGLKKLAKIYEDKDLLRIMDLGNVDDCYMRYLSDVIDLYDGIGDISRAELKERKVRIRDLHDWLVEKQKLEKYPICKFDNTEPIRKRLAMQLDQINFFIPNHSSDLVYAGENLHNCVGSYIKRVRDGETHIVLVTNEAGKLISCLEVRDGKLVQAKLSRNASASDDAKINAEIIEWAEKAGVDWKSCRDVREVRLPALISA
jgi:hypothetical protein